MKLIHWVDSHKTWILWCATGRRRHQLHTATMVDRRRSSHLAVLRQEPRDFLLHWFGFVDTVFIEQYLVASPCCVNCVASAALCWRPRSRHWWLLWSYPDWITAMAWWSVFQPTRCAHWLHIAERIIYKIAVLTYKVLYSSVPGYIGPVVRVADLPDRQALRSAGTNRLVVPPFNLSTISNRVFPVADPQVRNDLPEDITSAQLQSIFRRRLKTYLLFRRSFPHLIICFLLVDLAVTCYLGHFKNLN